MKKIQNEANFINKSLTTLGRIVRLVNEKKNTNLPYRESKLTRILQVKSSFFLLNLIGQPRRKRKNFNVHKYLSK